GSEMKQLGNPLRNCLKAAHIIITGIWLGSGVCMLILALLNRYLISPSDGSAYGINVAIKMIDLCVTVPAATLTLLTGFLISWLTGWGFFKHRWVTVKWVLTFVPIITGGVWIRVLQEEMIQFSKAGGLKAMHNPAYLVDLQAFILVMSGLVLVLLFMMVISVFKPWKKA
ncbi:MAG TPA: hypothetical protein VHY08_06900, partial [Bacillota bacterium]|nr:hypothetical protein [Bacillota bacterium]